jgi:hypothetical protein
MKTTLKTILKMGLKQKRVSNKIAETIVFKLAG